MGWTALCLAAGVGWFGLDPAWGREGLSALDSRGSYIGIGGGLLDWAEQRIPAEAGEAPLVVDYERGEQVGVVLGVSPAARVFRLRYELEGYYHSGEATARREVTANGGRENRSFGGDTTVYGGGLNIFYDLPPLVSGRLTPYAGIGGHLVAVDLDFPASVFGDGPGIDPAVIAERLGSETLAGFFDALGDRILAYGIVLMGGARIEFNTFVALDVNYRYVELDTITSGRRARFLPDDFQELRASLILRF